MSARGPSFAAELLKALRTERLSVRGACAAVDCSEKAAVYWLSEWEILGIVVTSTGEKGRTGFAPRVYTLAPAFGGVAMAGSYVGATE